MAARYRFRPGARAPAKDEDGHYMCEFSPYSHTVSPLLDISKPGKKTSAYDTGMKGEIGVAESCGSVPFPDGQRPLLHQHGMITDAGSILTVERTVGKVQADSQRSTADVVQRNPLQDANRDISAHPVRISNTQGSSQAGPDKVSASQQQSTAAFKEKHLRQMHAANERLEQTKLRKTSVSNSEHSDAGALRTHGSLPQKRSSSKREVVQTHLNVAELVTGRPKREDRTKPSTEALLRAASLGQQGTGPSASSRVPRTASMGQTKPSNDASKKLVFATLHSPNVEGAETTEVKPQPDRVDMKSRSRDEQNPGQKPHHLKQATVNDRKPSNTFGTKQNDSRQSTDSTRQSKDIPRSVAALANRFEAKAGAVAARGATKPAALPRANPTSMPVDQSGVQPSALPKAPSSVARTSSCEDVKIQAVQQGDHVSDVHADEASNMPPTSSAAHGRPLPQDPRVHRKGVTSTAGKLQRPSASNAAETAVRYPAETSPAPVPQWRIPTPAGLHSAVPENSPPAPQSAPLHAVAIPLHAAAFGSPMPGHVDVADASSEVKPARNSMISMSCNVNMASPTAGEAEVVSMWKRPAAGVPAVAGGRDGAEGARLVPPTARVAREQPGHDADVQPCPAVKRSPAKAREKLAKKSSTAQAAAASPPTRAAFARLSDACTSPVDSLWRPLKKALVPQGGNEDDALTTNLLAPDGSPALPSQNYASNSPQKRPTQARPATAHVHPTRPNTAGSTKARPSTAGPGRTLPPRPPLRGSEADTFTSESGSDQPSGLLQTGPDRLYSAGSAGKQALEPALSRGALEMSAAHLRGSVVNDEPFVDLMGVHVDSTYLKSGRSGASKGGCCSIM